MRPIPLTIAILFLAGCDEQPKPAEAPADDAGPAKLEVERLKNGQRFRIAEPKFEVLFYADSMVFRNAPYNTRWQHEGGHGYIEEFSKSHKVPLPDLSARLLATPFSKLRRVRADFGYLEPKNLTVSVTVSTPSNHHSKRPAAEATLEGRIDRVHLEKFLHPGKPNPVPNELSTPPASPSAIVFSKRAGALVGGPATSFAEVTHLGDADDTGGRVLSRKTCRYTGGYVNILEAREIAVTLYDRRTGAKTHVFKLGANKPTCPKSSLAAGKKRARMTALIDAKDFERRLSKRLETL